MGYCIKRASGLNFRSVHAGCFVNSREMSFDSRPHQGVRVSPRSTFERRDSGLNLQVRFHSISKFPIRYGGAHGDPATDSSFSDYSLKHGWGFLFYLPLTGPEGCAIVKPAQLSTPHVDPLDRVIATVGH